MYVGYATEGAAMDASDGPGVLLADDEVLVRDLVQEALEEAGFKVFTAGAGAEAQQILREHGADLRAMVTDINFGGPPSGWDVATFAREANRAIAVVYMTGDSAYDWSVRGVPDSVVIAKPFAPSQIVVALSSLLNQANS
jgi:two-component system cell cycle response regulator CpdR